MNRQQFQQLLDAMDPEARERFLDLCGDALGAIADMCAVVNRWTEAGLEAAENHANEETP